MAKGMYPDLLRWVIQAQQKRDIPGKTCPHLMEKKIDSPIQTTSVLPELYRILRNAA